MMAEKRSPGERITELCKTYSIDRATLAERSGLDVELVRRIEEDGFIPDLAPLIKIARALGVRLGTLMDDQEQLGPVITRSGGGEDTPRFITGLPAGSKGHDARGLSFKTLAADKGGRHMEPFVVDIESDAQQAKSTHEGEEFIYVLSGTLSLEYGKDSYELETGDSVYYDSIVPHRVLAGRGKAAKIVAVIYSPA
jgi:quercetin dioxygenase-like cupin family protein/transcriptional regulator with XRE-family HTH domain